MDGVDQTTNGKKISPLVSYLAEGGVVIVLVLAILFALNYFSLVPFSKIFPWLYFLPSQSQVNSLKSKHIATPKFTPQLPKFRYLVDNSESLTLTNDSQSYEYHEVPNSAIHITGELKLGIDMQILTDYSDKNATSSSSLTFGNGVYKSKTDYSFIELFYWEPTQNWSLHYHYNGKDVYYPLTVVDKGSLIDGIFTIAISGDGRKIGVDLPNGQRRNITLPTSLYAVTNNLFLNVDVAPSSTVVIHSLTYSY